MTTPRPPAPLPLPEVTAAVDWAITTRRRLEIVSDRKPVSSPSWCSVANRGSDAVAMGAATNA